MPPSLPAWLADANQAFNPDHPGESGLRQPVHVVYGGAHLFQAGLCRKLGEVAQRAAAEFAATPSALAGGVGIPETLGDTVYARVVEKLQREPVEDFRIDFEDGFGNRPDDEEDATATAAAAEVARGMAEDLLPPFIGIRIKPLNEELKARSVRT